MSEEPGGSGLGDVISVSRINTALSCEVKVKYRYIDNIIIPPDSARWLGLMYGEATEWGHRARINGHDTPPAKDLEDWFHSNWDEKERKANDTVGVGWEADDKPNDLKVMGANLLSEWREKVAVHVRPVTTQKEFYLDMTDRDGEAFQVHGFIDLIASPEKDDRLFIADDKTTKKKYDLDGGKVLSGMQGLQAIGYSYAESIPDFEWHVAVKTKSPQFQVVKVKISDEDHRLFLNMAQIGHNKLKALEKSGDFLPNRSHFTCTRRHCGYWRLCQEDYGGKVKP